ncbi:MAG: hypothetical protein K6U00_11155, partial [Armatimonadetes bacterium]|nr:hypothetical protein [Armatimonadota bacterium]
MEIRDRNETELQARLVGRGGSAASKYLDLVVGSRKLIPIIRFELLMGLSSTVPGALGYWLRSKMYPRLLRRAGHGVLFGRNVCIRHPARISLGDGVVIDDNCVLDGKGESGQGIIVGDPVLIGRNTILSCKGGSKEIG